MCIALFGGLRVSYDDNNFDGYGGLCGGELVGWCWNNSNCSFCADCFVVGSHRKYYNAGKTIDAIDVIYGNLNKDNSISKLINATYIGGCNHTGNVALWIKYKFGSLGEG